MRIIHAAVGFFFGGLTAVALGDAAFGVERMTVESVLELAKKNSESLQAIDQSQAAVEAEIQGRDLSLSPTLSSELGVVKDARATLNALSTRSGRTTFLDATLVKPFASGTKLSVNGRHEVIDAPANGDEEAHVGAWEARLSQSLWRDAFGRSTRLRREGESHELKRQRFASLLERQNFLASVESAFWDLALLDKEEEIRRKNLERSLSLEKWMKRRVTQFAAEKQDLLQVQTLVRQRRLDLTIVQNDRDEVENRMQSLIPGTNPGAWAPDLKSLEKDRSPRGLLANGQSASSGKPVRLDAIAAKYRSQELRTEVAKVDDALSPDLSLYASYGANGIDPKPSPAWTAAGKAETPVTTVGLQLAMELDGSIKDKRRSAARRLAEAQALRVRALDRASTLAWGDMERTIANFKNQIQEAREIYALHQRKLDAERKRFEQGRTSTLQITTFEVEAAESEVRLYRLLADLRKTEAVARTFAYDEGATR